MARESFDDVSKPDAIDAGQAIVRAAVGAVPVLGTAATELLNFVVTPPLEARRTEWLNALADDVDRLKEVVDGFEISALSQNDDFLSTVAVAVGVATRSSEQEKRDMLRNAVVNAALGHVPDSDLETVFIQYLGYLSPLHIQLLRVFDDPRAALDEVGSKLADTLYTGGPSQVVEEVFPQLKGRRDVYDFLWQDLEERRLVGSGGLHVTMTKDGVLSPRISSLGKQFLDFVSTPSELRA